MTSRRPNFHCNGIFLKFFCLELGNPCTREPPGLCPLHCYVTGYASSRGQLKDGVRSVIQAAGMPRHAPARPRSCRLPADAQLAGSHSQHTRVLQTISHWTYTRPPCGVQSKRPPAKTPPLLRPHALHVVTVFSGPHITINTPSKQGS